jgi:hypothetical protein
MEIVFVASPIVISKDSFTIQNPILARGRQLEPLRGP